MSENECCHVKPARALIHWAVHALGASAIYRVHRKSVSEGECPVIRAPDFDVYIVIYRKSLRVDEGHGFAL